MFGSARRTWVLGGGGARGAAQVGVLQALFEANIEGPAAVVGTSVGALNGASIAAYPSLAGAMITHCAGSPPLEIKPVYAKLAAAFFPRCNTTKIMCSEFSKTEDLSHASKSTAHARV